MAIREIQRAFEYICDGCNVSHLQENAAGHYRDSRPPHWNYIKVSRDAEDFQGQAVADASFRRLLCPTCTVDVLDAINSAIEKLRSKV